MALTIIGTLPLGSINIAAGTAVTLLGPLLGQFDAMLFGTVGLGALELDLSIQFNAVIQANIALANPFAAIQAALQALLTIQLSIGAMVAGGLPALNLNMMASIGVNLGLIGFLGAKLAGLQLMISAAINAKLPVIDFLAGLNIGASCVLASFGFASSDTLSSAGTSINSFFQTGFEGIAPGDTVYGVIILTKSPSASVALSGMILTT